MKMILFSIGMVVLFLSSLIKANVIYLKPGQCIVVGNQQVCAMELDKSAKLQNQKEKYIFRCKYAKHPGSDFVDLKTYAVVRIAVKNDGNTSEEIVIKDYGPNKKAECEKDAEQKNAELKNN